MRSVWGLQWVSSLIRWSQQENKAAASADRQKLSAIDQPTISNSWKEEGSDGGTEWDGGRADRGDTKKVGRPSSIQDKLTHVKKKRKEKKNPARAGKYI